jgi:hypothetical protein
MKTTIFLLAAALSLFLGASCNKFPVPITGPIPGSLPATPFMTWLDSISNWSNLSIDSEESINPIDLDGSQLPPQSEIGWAFRTSSPGTVVLLGVLEYAPGYQHTVTLWDSATGEVLAQANVPTTDTMQWEYVELNLTGQQVNIVPNHGYIVGQNTAAIGASINSNSPGNFETQLRTIIRNSLQSWYALPFTEGAITVEGYYNEGYTSPISSPIFPGSDGPAVSGVATMWGAVDIGFIPE